MPGRPCPWRCSHPGQGQLRELGALARPERTTVRAAPLIVEVLVDDLPGGAEQVNKLGWENLRRTCIGGCHVRSLLSSCGPAPCLAPVHSFALHGCAPEPDRLRCWRPTFVGAGWHSGMPASRNGRHLLMRHPGDMAVRCLIVDDNAEFRRAASDLLAQEGITVVGVAATGAQARDACRELTPDVVLLDVDLGEESGFEVARQLAGRTGLVQPQVILISAYSRDDFEEMIAYTPAVSFLSKASLSGAEIQRVVARGRGGGPVA